jgi:hypothetical protein
MTWIKKSKRISGNSVILDSIAGENLNCIDNNVNLSSNSELHVPSVEAVKAYVQTSGKQAVLEGFIENPTDVELVELARAQGIDLQSGQEFLYIQLELGTLNAIDSQIYTYNDNSTFKIVNTNTVLSDINHFFDIHADEDYTYLDNPLLIPEAGFLVITTSAFVLDKDAGTLTGTNASTSDYAGFFNWTALKVGYEYRLDIQVSSTDNVGCKLDIRDNSPDTGILKSVTIGHLGANQYTVYFTAPTSSAAFILYGKGGTDITISNLSLTQVAVHKAVHKISFPFNSKYTLEILESDDLGSATFDTGEALLLPSDDDPVDGGQSLEISLERQTVGKTRIKYRLTAYYSFGYVDPTLGAIQLDTNQSVVNTIIVRKD